MRDARQDDNAFGGFRMGGAVQTNRAKNEDPFCRASEYFKRCGFDFHVRDQIRIARGGPEKPKLPDRN